MASLFLEDVPLISHLFIIASVFLLITTAGSIPLKLFTIKLMLYSRLIILLFTLMILNNPLWIIFHLIKVIHNSFYLQLVFFIQTLHWVFLTPLNPHYYHYDSILNLLLYISHPFINQLLLQDPMLLLLLYHPPSP